MSASERVLSDAHVGGGGSCRFIIARDGEQRVTVEGFRMDATRGGRAIVLDLPETKPGQVPRRLVLAPHEARALIAALESACIIAEGATT